ncbi:MAG: helix-turn-helix transcriptional regulator [Ruminococcaceae bacterium]|nr:helix-turn-helix transcriptional regulator [Oscillospiraceae bacterium]
MFRSIVLKFGEKIKKLREEAEINQTELGKAVHMTQRKVSYIECGKCEPSIEDIIAFCEFFKVSSDYLLGVQKGYKYP